MYMPGIPTLVYARVYLPGYTVSPTMPAVYTVSVLRCPHRSTGPRTEPWAQLGRNPWVGDLLRARARKSVTFPMSSARGCSALPRAESVKIG